MTDGSTADTKRSAKPKRGDVLDLETHAFAFEGKAVGRREDGYVVFVESALANENIRTEILKAKGSYAEGKLLEVLRPSPDRRAPICPYFGTCGGCSLQHMSYAEQLRSKTQQVRDLFERIGGIHAPPVRDAIGNADEYHYRNKMEYSFSEERWLMPDELGDRDTPLDRFALGLHVRNRFDRVLDTHVCFLPKPVTVDILNFTRQFAREHAIGVFHPDRTPEGLARFLVIRTSEHTGEIMVNFVTSRRDEAILQRYTNELVATIPSVTTVVNNVNGRRAQIAVGEEEIVYHGTGYMYDRIGHNSFRISANSFFQTNSPQAETLYEIARDYAELRPDDELWDLYCGTGTIALFNAPNVRHVLGVELVEAAILDARENAKANDVANADFVSSDLRRAITSPEFLAAHPKPSVMIIDPPRSGMHPDVVREVLALEPERISYISCNPATQARDVALLLEKYELLAVQPVDMFPQTYHIESVAKLRRR